MPVKYSKAEPLVCCHIPKMGGTSIRELFQNAFQGNLFLHYNQPIVRNNVLVSRLPGRIDWGDLKKLSKVASRMEGGFGTCIYGHFRNSESTGVDDYYPEASQFALVLRSPLDAAISSYHYTKQMIKKGTPIPLKQKTLNDFLESNNSQLFNHLPCLARKSPEKFIDESVVCLATLEGKKGLYDFFEDNFGMVNPLPRRNASEHSEIADESVIKKWLQRNKEECSFYKLVQDRESRFA